MTASQNSELENMKQEISQLQELLLEKNTELEVLQRKIETIETRVIFDQKDSDLESETTFSEVEQLVSESSNTCSESEDEDYPCDQCDFRTKKKNGLKVHIGRVHSMKCKSCGEVFILKEKFERHFKLEIMMENICETACDDLNLVLDKNKPDEICLAVFSQKEAREDGLPLLYLHGSECWTRSGHVCSDLPPMVGIDPDPEDTIFVDYDFYNPIKHSMLELVVMGDLSMGGCYPDWARVKQVLDKQ